MIMGSRKIKDAKDLTTGELIYFKGHAKATYTSNGTTVEEEYVSKIPGKGLSTNDFTDEYKFKVDSIDTKQNKQIVTYVDTNVIEVAYPEHIYIFDLNNKDLVVHEFYPPSESIARYTFYFRGARSVIFPTNTLWAHGESPFVETTNNYELSVLATKMGDEYIYKAVLIPFKIV